jgi:hypothetical protein
MKWMIVAIVEVVLIVIIVIIANNYRGRLIESQSDILVLINEKEILLGLNSVLENDKMMLQNDKVVLERSNSVLMTEKAVLEKKLKATLPYNLANDQILSLVNQTDVNNPSWRELKDFLRDDRTEFFPFVDNVFVCENFAVMLHDNAEKKKIRAGVVFIDFENDDVGHMINAFYTVDQGLVYVDDTGRDSVKCIYDSIAYIEIGKNYGTLDVKAVTSFLYEDYEKMKLRWQRYNQNVRDFNNYISGKTFVMGSAEEEKVNDWSDRIDDESVGLPDCLSDSMGIVQSIEIRW